LNQRQQATSKTVYIRTKLSPYPDRYNFVLPEDSGASDYRDKYLPDRPEKGYEFYSVAFAEKR
jgi:hypothetical protein